MKGKPERAYAVDLERDRERLRQLGLDHPPHGTSLHRTRRRLTEEYVRRLNEKIREGLEGSKRLGADATGLRQSTREGAWSNTSEGDRFVHLAISATIQIVFTMRGSK